MANETLEQNINIKTNFDDVIKSLAKGYDSVEKSTSKAFSIGKSSEKSYVMVEKFLNGQKSVLKDIQKIKEVQKGSTLDESKDIESILGKFTKLQKKMKSSVDDEKVTASLVEENDKLVGQLDSIVKKYEEQHDVHKEINDQLIRTTKLNHQMFGPKTKNEIAGLVDELMLVSASMSSMGEGEFLVAKASLADITKKADEFLTKIEDTESVYQKINEEASDVELIEKRIGVLSGQKLKDAKLLLKRHKELSDLSKNLEDPNLDDDKRKRIEKIIEDQLESNKNIVKESMREVDVLRDLERMKDRGLGITKEDIKAIKERRKLLDEEMKSKGVSSFERKRTLNKLEPLKNPIAAKAQEVGEMSKGFKSALKPLESVGNTLARVLPPLTVALGALSFVGFAAMLVMMEKKVKEARRQFVGLAAETGELDAALDKTGKTGGDVSSELEKYRIATTRYIGSIGVSVDDAQAGYSSLVKSGFRLNEIIDRTPYKKLGLTTDGFEQMFVQGQMAGKSIDEMAGYAGTLREEYALTLDKSVEAFDKITAAARNSGMATSRFYDKVINTATGMALYGAKIDEVAGSFAALTKNIRLPEKAAADAAARLTSHFKDLSTEQQILIGDLSGYSKNISTLFDDLNKGGAIGEAAKLSLENLGFDQRDIDAVQKVTDPLEKSVEMMRRLKPGEQVKATMNALSKTALGLDLNNSTIDDIDKAFQANTYKLEKVGESFGLSREDIKIYQELFAGIKENSTIQKSMNDQITKGKFDPAEFKNGLQKNNKELWSKFQNSGEKDVVKFVKGLDTNFQSAMNFDKMLEDSRSKKAKTEEIRKMRQNTQSFVDAIEQSIQKILLDIFAVLEPGFNFVVSLLKQGWKILRGGFSGLLKFMVHLPGVPQSLKNISSRLDLETQAANTKDRYDELINEQKKNEKQQDVTNQLLSNIEDKRKSGKITEEDKKNETKYKKDLTKLQEEHTVRQEKEIAPIKKQAEHYEWAASLSDEQLTKEMKKRDEAIVKTSMGVGIGYGGTMMTFEDPGIKKAKDIAKAKAEEKAFIEGKSKPTVVQEPRGKYDVGSITTALDTKQSLDTKLSTAPETVNLTQTPITPPPVLTTPVPPPTSDIAAGVTNINDRSDKSTSTSTDNKTVNIIVNQRDVPTIKQIVREELHAAARK
jgi:hypothetical protein